MKNLLITGAVLALSISASQAVTVLEANSTGDLTGGNVLVDGVLAGTYTFATTSPAGIAETIETGGAIALRFGITTTPAEPTQNYEISFNLNAGYDLSSVTWSSNGAGNSGNYGTSLFAFGVSLDQDGTLSGNGDHAFTIGGVDITTLSTYTAGEEITVANNTAQDASDDWVIVSGGATTQTLTMAGESGEALIFSAEVVVVPEPSSTALLGLGGLALLMRRRR